MNFENLNLSLKGYQNTAPTLFQVLCTVKSFFEDIEDIYDLEVSQCAAGSDSLPTEVYWLCTQIQEIYQEKKELISSRPRVEDAVKKLEIIRAELGQFAGVSEKLSAAEAEYAQLETQLRSKKDMELRWSQLCQEIRKAKELQAALQVYDFAAAQQELEEIRRQCADLQRKKENLERGVEGARLDRDGLLKKIDADQTEYQMLQEQIKALKEQWTAVQEQIRKAKEQREELEEKLQEDHRTCHELGSTVEHLQKQVDLYEAQQMAPLREQQRNLQKQVDDLEQQRQQLQQEVDGITQRRDQLVLGISRQKSANEDMQDTIESNQRKLEQLEQEAQKLESRVNELVAQLSVTQCQVESLKEQKLPEAETLLEEEKNRKDKHTEQIRQLTEEKNKLCSEIAVLEQKLPELQSQLAPLAQKLENTQQTYNEIAARVTTGNETLNQLKENIEELKSKNPEQNYILYQNQLLEEKRKLEDYCVKLQDVQAELQKLQEEMDREKQRLDQLESQKEQYEANYARTKSLRQKLEPLATDGNVRRLEEIGQQLRLLETVRHKLANSVDLLHRNLGAEAFDEKLSLEDRFQATLQELKLRTDDLRKNLLDCADSLKNATKV